MDRTAFTVRRILKPLVGLAIIGASWWTVRVAYDFMAGEAPPAPSLADSSWNTGTDAEPFRRRIVEDEGREASVPLVPQAAGQSLRGEVLVAGGAQHPGFFRALEAVPCPPPTARVSGRVVPAGFPNAQEETEPKTVSSGATFPVLRLPKVEPVAPQETLEPADSGQTQPLPPVRGSDDSPLPSAPAEPQAPAETVPPIERTPPVESAPPTEQAPPVELPIPAEPQSPGDPLPERSEQLERVAQQADRQTRRGFELASRQAYFAARAEFIASLRLVAQGLDTERRTTAHSRALADALNAIKEAEDFLPTDGRLEGDLDVPKIIAVHRTSVLKETPPAGLTPMVAMKQYLSYAQEQFAKAAGREVAGSMALHALGKLHAALATQKNIRIKATEPKAVVFYQAAILVSPQNYLAANDLGVLLARGGRCSEACSVLQHSLAVYAQSVTWHNLAVVYGQLGQMELARQAEAQSQRLRQAEIAARQPADQLVRWVDPGVFAESYARMPAWESVPARTAGPPGQGDQPAVPTNGRTAAGGRSPSMSPY